MKKPFLLLIFIFGLVRFAEAQDLNKLRSQIDSLAQMHKMASIGFAVAFSDSMLIADAVGYRNLEDSIPADANTVYRIGSITKTFVSLGIMRLAEEGRLNLDARLRDYIPELPITNRWSAESFVKVKDLLEHTAGFRDLLVREYDYPPDTEFQPLKEVLLKNPIYWRTRWEPGTRHAYSNPGYTALGYIIELVTQRPYHEYLEEIILKPLQMNQTDFLGRDHSNLAMSYTSSGEPDYPGIILDHPAGLMHTTPADMQKFIRFMLNRTTFPNGSRLLSDEYFDRMLYPESIVGANGKMMGYGKGIYSNMMAGHYAYGHDGGIDAYVSLFICIPESKVGYYYTITASKPAVYQTLQDLFQKTFAPKPEQTEKITFTDPNTHQDLLGWYFPEVHRIEVFKLFTQLGGISKLYINNDTLWLKPLLNKPQALYSLGNGYFSLGSHGRPQAYIGQYRGKTVISSSFGIGDGFFEKRGFIGALWKPIIIGLSLLFFLSSAFISTVNIVVNLFQNAKTNLRPLVWKLVGLISVILYIIGFSAINDLEVVTAINGLILTLAFGSILFLVSCIAGLMSLRKGPVHTATWRSIPLYLGYGGWLLLNLFLFAYGLIPLFIWNA
jgi:CubicO group peptidase (beta-lactamase class C family)